MFDTTPRWRDWLPADRLNRPGPIIVGYTGSPASLRAIASAPRLVNAPTQTLLISAITRRRGRTPRPFPRDYDVLKDDAYLLSPSAVIDETLRRGRETAWDAGLKDVVTQMITADPVHALATAARSAGARAIIVGVGGSRPSRQLNRLAKALPDDVSLIATDGFAPLVAVRQPHVEVAPLRYSRAAVPSGQALISGTFVARA